MSLCRHFLAGKCRYGDRCRFSHQTSDVKRASPATKMVCEKCSIPMNINAKLCASCRPRQCKFCTKPATEGRDACLSCQPIDCQHCHGPLKGERKYCPDCTPHSCGYCTTRPGAKEGNIVRGRLSYNERVCCEECKDYYCIKHTRNLFISDYHKHVVCQECREKCFYCEHRTKEKANKKLKKEEACLDCLSYFCRSHNWVHAKDLKLSAPTCPDCRTKCWVCQGPITKMNSWSYELICKKCSENYCPSCQPIKAKEVKNTFRCSKCTYLHGCQLSSHGSNNQNGCTCEERRWTILGINYRKLPTDLVHPDYEVMATYNVEDEEHDGYCSDHYNDRMTEMTVTKIYPLPVNFTPENVDWSFYERDREGHGNGYCGLKTIYTLTSLKVIDKGEGWKTEKIKKKKHRGKDYGGWSTDEEYKVKSPRRWSDSDSAERTSTEED